MMNILKIRYLNYYLRRRPLRVIISLTLHSLRSRLMIFHRTPINLLLVNLAVADILYAMFVTPDTFLMLASSHPGGTTGTVLCKLLTGGNLAWVAGTSSVVTLVAIASERYYAVIYPIGNFGKLTKRKLKVRH